MKFLKKQKKENQRTGRTIPSAKAPVFSYYSSRSQPSTDRSAKRQSPREDTNNKSRLNLRWFGYLPAIFSLILVLASLFFATTLTTDPRVEIVPYDNRPAAIQDAKIYQAAAQKILSSSIFNRSKLTINTDKVAEELVRQYSELGETVITVPLISRRPIITIQPAIPVLLVQISNETYVIDESGRTVLKANQLQSSIRDSLPILTDQSGMILEIGKQSITTDLVSLISALQIQFEAQKVKIESYTLPSASNEVDVRVVGKPYYIKFTVDADSRVQVGTYLAVSQKLESEGIIPVEYIDVRIEERAYYK